MEIADMSLFPLITTKLILTIWKIKKKGRKGEIQLWIEIKFNRNEQRGNDPHLRVQLISAI